MKGEKRNISRFGLLFLMLGFGVLMGCSNLQKPVDIDLPVYESELAVECYLEPGKRYRLLLTQSVPYLDGSIIPEIVADAEVIISHDGISDTLLFDPSDFLDPNVAERWFEGNKKVYNYKTPAGVTVPYSPGTTFELYIKDPAGRELTASTVMLPTVEIDTNEIEFNSAGDRFLVRTRWQDDANQASFYRYSQHKLKKNGKLKYEFSLTLDDRVGNGEEFIVSSFYDWEPQDCVVTTLYHIDEAMVSYIRTTDDAESSNGNPFAQPGSIISNVDGGIGIFSCLSYSRDTIWNQ